MGRGNQEPEGKSSDAQARDCSSCNFFVSHCEVSNSVLEILQRV
jgi:hypothetical protein